MSPTLPPEIWLDIIHLLTRIPSDFDLKLFRLEAPKPVAEKFLRLRLVNSRHILRVCRQFRTLATPLFYETVWISKDSQLTSLIAALEYERTRLLDVSIGIGYLIKRIVFTPFFPQFSAPGDHPTLSLIHLCPTVTSLHFLTPITFADITVNTPPEEHKELTFFDDLPLPTLQVLNLRRMYPQVSPGDLGAYGGLLKRATKLEVLRLDGVILIPTDTSWLAGAISPFFHLPSLEALAIPAALCSRPSVGDHPIASSDAPLTNLKELIWIGIREAAVERGLSPPHSPKLRRIALTVPSDYDFGHVWSSSGTWFPSIEHLDFVFNTWHAFSALVGAWNVLSRPLPQSRQISDDDFSCAGARELELISEIPPTLERIGLFTRNPQSNDDVCSYVKQFCEFLTRQKHQGQYIKRMKAVQLLSHSTCRNLKTRHSKVLKGSADALRTAGMVLLGADGEVIV
ncbi:hypothetical protein ONZ45_g11679 [Pleurotus djamor]|nr:hypothetical protein ONZ45_g11679 [Pleurotus djamor]